MVSYSDERHERFVWTQWTPLNPPPSNEWRHCLCRPYCEDTIARQFKWSVTGSNVRKHHMSVRPSTRQTRQRLMSVPYRHAAIFKLYAMQSNTSFHCTLTLLISGKLSSTEQRQFDHGRIYECSRLFVRTVPYKFRGPYILKSNFSRTGHD